MYKKRNRLGHKQSAFNKASRKTNPILREEGFAFMNAAEKGYVARLEKI
jgi:hypothetical protein